VISGPVVLGSPPSALWFSPSHFILQLSQFQLLSLIPLYDISFQVSAFQRFSFSPFVSWSHFRFPNFSFSVVPAALSSEQKIVPVVTLAAFMWSR
jgi:hypothetical protein